MNVAEPDAESAWEVEGKEIELEKEYRVIKVVCVCVHVCIHAYRVHIQIPFSIFLYLIFRDFVSHQT